MLETKLRYGLRACALIFCRLGPSQAVIGIAYPGLLWPLPAGSAHSLKFLPDRLRLLAFQKHELFKELHYASEITELNSHFKIIF